MKKLFIPFILIVICCFSGQPISSQVGTATVVDNKFKVAVLVDIPNEDKHKISKASIESYIKRELRSLKDVRIVGNEYPGTWKYRITVGLIANTYKSGGYTGRSTVSYTWYEKVDNHHFNDHWKDFHKKHPAFYLPQFGLATYNIDNLDKLCKSIVAGFDTAALEPVRESREKR